MENLFDAATPSVVVQFSARTSAPPEPADGGELATARVPFSQYITTFVERTDRLTMNAVEVAAGTGSGVVWDRQGHIVCAWLHVATTCGGEDCSRLAVTT